MNELVSAALAYVKQGWAITPLHWIEPDGSCSCGNPWRDPEHDHKQGGKHPLMREWQNKPISTLDEVTKAWERWPRANIGGLTGVRSRLWVLDMDPDNGAQLSDIPAVKEAGRVHQTGSGGYHFVYRTTDEFEPTNARGDLPPGWDVRGTGGQVVLPPSVTGKGAYRVVKASSLTKAPRSIEEMILRKKSAEDDVPLRSNARDSYRGRHRRESTHVYRTRDGRRTWGTC